MADGATKRPILFVFCLSIAFLWPILLNGSPYYFGDTEGYLRGGELALQFAGSELAGLFGSGRESADVTDATSGIYGVRSVAYAVFAYLTKWPGDSLLMTAWVQAVCVIFVLDTLFRMSGLFEKSPQTMLAIYAILICLTPAPWFANFATPDVFAGIAILSIALLTAWPETIPIHRRVVLAGFICFSVIAHLSHIPILGLVTALSGGLLLLAGWRDLLKTILRFAWIGVPALVGLGGAVAINFIGFDEASVSGKRYPILLARSIEDGPARWYLEEACAEEPVYAVCELYPDNDFPSGAGEFLWDDGGIRNIATPEQMERIRDEEAEILEIALARYPFASFVAAIRGSGKQMYKIGLIDHRFEFELKRDAEGEIFTAVAGPKMRAIKVVFAITFLFSYVGALGALIWALRTRSAPLNGPSSTLLVVVASGILINAVICASLSAVADRYQGRVIWTLIAAIAVFVWAHLQTQTQDETNA